MTRSSPDSAAFHASLEPLVIGVALALMQHGGAFRPSSSAGSRLLAASTAVLLAWIATDEFMSEVGVFDATAQPTLIACLCGLMTWGAIRLAATPMPAASLIRLVSRLSYSLYLVHYPLLPLAVAAARSSEYDTAVFWACYFTTSFACAGLLYLSIERPFLRLRDALDLERRGGACRRPPGHGREAATLEPDSISYKLIILLPSCARVA